jgi:hypothetical protein
MIVICLTLGLVTGAPAQRFDAASIKPCASDIQVPSPGRGLAGGTNAPSVIRCEVSTVPPATLGLPVIDRTSLKDEFIIRLEFHPDDNTPGIVWPAQRDADTSAPQAASVVTALEQRLGLKLETIEAPRGSIVIDHIEKPTPDGPSPVLAGAGR